ncbi:hypothetical protein GPM17_11910 [Pseudomonas putida]|nr:hypothetical protein GPM17_11910 [Pseudomonas putida]
MVIREDASLCAGVVQALVLWAQETPWRPSREHARAPRPSPQTVSVHGSQGVPLRARARLFSRRYPRKVE